MSIHQILKRLIMKEVLLVSTIPILLFRSLAINASPHIKIANFCTETAIPSPTPPDGGVVTYFFISKCGMTEKDVSRVLKLRKGLLHKPNQDLEESLELLSEFGLTTPAQIRRVVLGNPGIFLCKSKRDLKSRLSYLRSIMNKEDICKLLYTHSRILVLREDRLKSAVSVLQRLGIEGDALSKLLARVPRLLTHTEEKVMESFKVAERLGLERGSKIFGHALRALVGMGKEKIDRKRQFLCSLGFSEKQIYKLLCWTPGILGLSEEKLKRKVDFLVKSQGLPLDDIAKYACLLTCNLETRIIPRYRVMEALKSMQLLKTERIAPYFVQYTDKKFLEKYVNGNPEYSSVLRDIYYGEKAVKANRHVHDGSWAWFQPTFNQGFRLYSRLRFEPEPLTLTTLWLGFWLWNDSWPRLRQWNG